MIADGHRWREPRRFLEGKEEIAHRREAILGALGQGSLQDLDVGISDNTPDDTFALRRAAQAYMECVRRVLDLPTPPDGESDRTSLQVRIAVVSGRGQGQDRPEALPPGGQEVGGDLVQEGVAGDHGLHEQGLEAGQLGFEGGKPQEIDDVHRYRR